MGTLADPALPRRGGVPEIHAAPLPATVTFGIDRDGSVRRRILEAMQLPGNVSLPVFLIGDTFNRVVFESHGYTIGLGDRLLHTIHQL